jgi:hypothetical protein
MDMGLHDGISVAMAAKQGLARLVADSPHAARFSGFAGSVSAPAGVKLREAFANLIRQIPAGCGSSIAAHCFATRSLF